MNLNDECLMIYGDKNKYGLTQRNMQELFSIFKKYPDIREVYLFGSRAKGTHHSGSDIDLAVMNSHLNPQTLSSIKADFEDSNIPVRVDVVDFTTLTNPDFIEHIKRAGILFYTINNVNAS